jgi:hypothetical protein
LVTIEDKLAAMMLGGFYDGQRVIHCRQYSSVVCCTGVVKDCNYSDGTCKYIMDTTLQPIVLPINHLVACDDWD